MSTGDQPRRRVPAEGHIGGGLPAADEDLLRHRDEEESDLWPDLLTDDDLSMRDRDLIEPGLAEAELGALVLGDVAEEEPSRFDESGTGDESSAAAEDLGEETDLVAGSEPMELPGATDDLFPQEDDEDSIRDGGEEGLPDSLADTFDDYVRSDDLAWQQGGPVDETDALGGELEFPAAAERDPTARPAATLERVDTTGPVIAIASWEGCLAALVEPTASESGLRLEFLVTGGPPWTVPLPPPLRFGDEPLRVTGLVSCLGSWVVTTDRGMVFVAPAGRGAGKGEWLVADRYVGRDGTMRSWLPLGMSRRPFELLSSSAEPGRVWAWRPGGPLLRWSLYRGWVLQDEARSLRALTEDVALRRILLGIADEEGGELRWLGPQHGEPGRLGRLDGGGAWSLPGDATDMLLAPGACIAARAGTVWLGCRDPELPLMRGTPETGAWEAVTGVHAVRLLVALPDGTGALAVRIDPFEETDELVWVTGARQPPRLLVRARDLPAEGSPGPATGSRDRIDEVLLDRTGTTAWIRSAGQVYSVGFGRRTV